MSRSGTPSPLRSPLISPARNVNDGSGVPNICGNVWLLYPFGANAIGAGLSGVVPSKNVIVPVGLVVPRLGWTVAVRLTFPPADVVAGFAVTLVVAAFCAGTTP